MQQPYDNHDASKKWTLSGYATSYWEKDAAEKAAKRVYGVKAVPNDIQIKFGSIRTSVI